MKYAAIKDDKAVTGNSLAQIVRQIFYFYVDMGGNIHYRLQNSNIENIHPTSISPKDFSLVEFEKQAVKILKKEVENLGYKFYKEL